MTEYKFRVFYTGKFSIDGTDDIGIFCQKGETTEKACKALLKRLNAANLGRHGCLKAVPEE